jgi:DNA-binding response OmpR family regulator
MTKQTVLVVDDEPFICRSLTFVLRKADYHVVEARNGEEAIAAIRQHRPDLVFMDVMMPKVSGFEVCAQVKQDPDLKQTRIVLLTAKGQSSDRDLGIQAGADDYLTKPFSPTKILERARELLGR